MQWAAGKIFCQLFVVVVCGFIAYSCNHISVCLHLWYKTQTLKKYVRAVTLRVLTKQQDGHTVRLTPQEAAPQVFHAMFSQASIPLLSVYHVCHNAFFGSICCF